MAKMNEYDKSLLPKGLQIHWSFESDIVASWLESVPQSIKSLGEKRIREYAASRHSLAQVSGIHEISELEIENHHHLKHHPDLIVSLSHTRGISAAICSKQHHSVGIDIEHMDRKFKSETAKFFKTSKDDDMNLLQLWSVKEAAFKAVDPMGFRLENKTILVLKDLVVKKQKIELAGKPIASWLCQKHDGLITSVAWLE